MKSIELEVEPKTKASQPLMGIVHESHEQYEKKKDVQSSTTLVSNGCVDIRGNIADKRETGGWKASPFIIVNEVAERLAFYAIAVTMVSYLVGAMHQSLPDAATHVTDWIGAAFVLTILGAFIADAYLGRFKTIITFSCIYAVGMVLLTLSASLDSLRPPPCIGRINCKPATGRQTAFLYCALGLIALGTGGIKPCVSTFGADQFDIEDEKSPKEILILQLVLLCYQHGCTSRYQKPTGSAFTRFVQVGVASVRNHRKGVRLSQDTQLYEVNSRESDIIGAGKLPQSTQYRFLDKAAVITDHEASTTNRWKLCTVTQVEEFKSFIRVLPIWASTIALAISFAQMSTFFVSQAALMDRHLGSSFEIPPGSVAIFAAINALILVPLYEGLVVPILRRCTGHRRGSAEVFTYVGQLEFFYDEATDGTRSLSSALFLSEIGIGSWLSTALVKIIQSATGGVQEGWLRNTLNTSRLDKFYWVIAAINAVNFFVYLLVSWRFKASDGVGNTVRDESMIDRAGGTEFDRSRSG
ncbi:hypothetical protein IFM89_037655 [Coptis chinensis]|uniref:NPF family transporter n=1 Tax=Coptis chinensis TaxID=261450 RepID=A0A835MDJ9_9MAGN|nr:hypothetical protein IFM89_037655 [Coptis chinensis]